MSEAEITNRWKAVQVELRKCRRRLKDVTLPTATRAKYETRVLMCEGFLTGLTVEREVATR